MDLNTITLSGNLTRDPELRTTNGGKSVTSMRVASKGYGDRTLFIDATLWDKAAEIAAEAFSKGSKVSLIGELQSREWTDKEGNDRTSFEINVRSIVFPPKSANTSATVVLQGDGEAEEILF